METKKCSECGKVKSTGEFHKKAAAADGLTGKCKDCRNAAQRKRETEYSRTPPPSRLNRKSQAYDPVKERVASARRLAREAGMSEAAYEARRSLPCDICYTSGDPLSPYKGHGAKVLGWICRKCNRGLGNFAHDPDCLRRALAMYDGE